jgi:phage portal protein BeeE
MGLMSYLGQSLGFTATRNTDGPIYYTIGHQTSSIDGFDNKKAALYNPILLGLIDRIALYVAQTDFFIGESDSRKKNDPLINLINNPNEYQSKQDFLKEYVFQRIVRGATFMAPIGSEGFE